MMADEVAEIAGVSKSKGYAIIRQLNSELEAQGFITIAGRVSRRYFAEKYYGYEGATVSDEPI
ncbi:DNA-binding protein [Eubacteriaceae bacterium ES2]|nr:DNA-binding protein [Eubacteriaceae bacterium ES2]